MFVDVPRNEFDKLFLFGLEQCIWIDIDVNNINKNILKSPQPPRHYQRMCQRHLQYQTNQSYIL